MAEPIRLDSESIKELAKALKGQDKPTKPPAGTTSSSGLGRSSGKFGISKGAEKKFESVTEAFTYGLGNAGGTVGEFSKALGAAVPGFGWLGDAVGNVIGYLEDTNNVFQNLSKVGAGFNGDLGALRAGAANSGLTLNQFANLIGQNSKNLAGLGAGVNNGAKRFAQLSNAMLSGDVINGMMNLGYSIEESNAALLDNAVLLGRQQRLTGMSDQRVAEATLEMSKNMAFVAEITGESAEKQRQDLLDAQRDGKNIAAMRLAEAKGAKDAQQMFNQSMQSLGPLGEQAKALYQDYFQVGAPVSQMTKDFETMNPQIAAQIRQMAALSKANSNSIDTATKERMIRERSNQALLQGARNQNDINRLQVATTGQITRMGASMADTIANNEGYTRAIEAQRAQLAKDRGVDPSTITLEDAFNSLDQEVKDRIRTQASGSGNNQLSDAINQATIQLARDASKANLAIAGHMSANKTFIEKATETMEGLVAANSVLKTGTTEFLNFIAPGSVTKQNLEANNFKELFTPLINNGALNVNVVGGGNTGTIPGDTPDARQGVFGGGREFGGPVSAGKIYKVGEEGTEIFSPMIDGTIIPNMKKTINSAMSRQQNAPTDMRETIAKLRGNIEKATDGKISTEKMEELLDNLNQSVLQLVSINTNVEKLNKNQIAAIRGAGNLLSGVTSR